MHHQVLTRKADVKEGKSNEAALTFDLINQNKEQVLVLSLAVSLGYSGTPDLSLGCIGLAFSFS